MTPDLIIVGGGAAGLMAALFAGRAGARVLLLERNEKLGKKIYITGKGRCNLTNTAQPEQLMASIVRNPRFLYAPLSRLSNTDVMRLFEQELGVPLKEERGGRVFPVSDHASDISRALEAEIRRLGVSVRLNCRVKRLQIQEGRARGVLLENGEALCARAVILATGGLSYPSTGSTGDGMRMAEESGHALTPCRPALVPIETVESWPGTLSGLSLKNVSLRAAGPKKKPLYEAQGELLFTHFGLSGPLTLSLSSHLPDEPSGTPLSLDLKPALTPEMLDRRLLRDFEANQNKRLLSILEGLAPHSLAAVLAALLAGEGLAPDTPVHSVTAAQRRAIAALLKGVPLTVRAFRGLDEAIVTRGGVSVKEISPSTMASRRVEGLYFAGETIDIDALTGGFNLQLAFSTGALAGASAAEYAKEQSEEQPL